MSTTSCWRSLWRGATLLLVVIAGLSAAVTSAAVQTDGTPAALGALEVLDSQTERLDGASMIWQVSQVTANPEDGDNPEFEVRLGFVYADQIPVTLTVDGGDPVELAVGESLAVKDDQRVTAFATDGTLGSFKTLELINTEATDVTVEQEVVGAPFTPNAGDYVLELLIAELDVGVARPLPTVDLPAMVLVLEGNVVHARDDGEATNLTVGEAGAGTGAGNVVAGPDGTTFLIVTVTSADSATPESS